MIENGNGHNGNGHNGLRGRLTVSAAEIAEEARQIAERQRASELGRVTFDEIRRTARWLGLFGPSDLADALRCHPEVAERGITALRAHRLVVDTGEDQSGAGGDERVWEMVPLPDTIYKRDKRTPPEIAAVIQAGGFLLFDQRGYPVRLRAERDMRRVLSTPGARKVHRERERAYERQQRAVAMRAEAQKRKSKNYVPKWKRKSAAKIALAEQVA